MSGIARTLEPPYYAVIFTFERTEGDQGHAEMAWGLRNPIGNLSNRCQRSPHRVNSYKNVTEG